MVTYCAKSLEIDKVNFDQMELYTKVYHSITENGKIKMMAHTNEWNQKAAVMPRNVNSPYYRSRSAFKKDWRS